jgi:hypothetical protein
MSSEIKDSDYVLYFNSTKDSMWFRIFDYDEEGKKAANRNLKDQCMSLLSQGLFIEACDLTVWRITKTTIAHFSKKEFMTMGELKEHDQELMNAFQKALTLYNNQQSKQ